jgi:hypothetical protein
MVAAREELRTVEAELASLRQVVAGNGGGLDARRLAGLEERARAAASRVTHSLHAIHEAGAQVKDLDRGLVDFPARHPRTGETVLLCWHVGEDTIAYWHGFDEGFAGRKRLPF